VVAAAQFDSMKWIIEKLGAHDGRGRLGQRGDLATPRTPLSSASALRGHIRPLTRPGWSRSCRADRVRGLDRRKPSTPLEIRRPARRQAGEGREARTAGQLATNTFPLPPNLFCKLQGCHENNAENLKIIA